MENAYLKKAESKSTRGGKLDKRERFEVIHELKKEFSVCRLVQLAKVSRAETLQMDSFSGATSNGEGVCHGAEGTYPYHSSSASVLRI